MVRIFSIIPYTQFVGAGSSRAADGMAKKLCFLFYLYRPVTCRVLVLLTRSGFWHERDIIISFRGDLDSTGSCSQIVRLFSTV